MEHDEFKFSKEDCGLTSEASDHDNFLPTAGYRRGNEVKSFTGKQLEDLEGDLVKAFEEEGITPDQVKLGRDHFNSLKEATPIGFDLAS